MLIICRNLGVKLILTSVLVELTTSSSCQTMEDNRSKGNSDEPYFLIPNKPSYEQTLTAQPDPFKTDDPTTQAKVLLRSDLFGSDQDAILYYAFLITKKCFALPPECGRWNATDVWPSLPNWQNISVPYQITPIRWNPFTTVEPVVITTASYIIGDGSHGENDSHYWNKPLARKTKYAFKIRAFTETGYQDTDVIYFETLDELPILQIFSVLLAIWMFTMIALCLTIFDIEWIKSFIATSGRKSKDFFSPVPETLSHKSFLKYAEDLLNNPGRLGNEFHLLGTLSSDVSTLCLHAQRVDNKKKNRYGNILPFDMTRVKLSVADDDPSSDYINASFIKGYTQQVEYIACQGPQAETCHDFYRMIIEQNVEVIVMLTNLIENGKEKCYKYYPNEGQILSLKDVSIFCDKEEDFEFFKKRTLTIVREGKKMSVIQFHHTQWRDFACPQSTADMLKFCELVQKTPRKGSTVVHCSAGSGRTGTFIAIDILLQRVRQSNKINVFDTVLKLRQQRVGMVQTEAQLGYIYKCVSRAIEGFSTKNKENV